MARAWRISIGLAGAAALIAAGPTAPSVRLSASESAAGARLAMRWPEGTRPAAVTASVSGETLTVRVAEPIQATPQSWAAGAPATLGDVRASADGRTFTLSLRRAVTAQVEAAPQGVDVALRAAASGAATSATLTIGETETFTRLSFLVPGGATITPLQRGEQLSLRFSRPLEIDLSALTQSPPRFVKRARVSSRPGERLALDLTLDDGVRQRHFAEGGRVVVDLLPASAPQLAPAPVAAASAPAASAARVTADETPTATSLSVRWTSPVRAAAFRRDEAIWLLFDSSAQLDLSGVDRVTRRYRDVRVVNGQGVVGLRIAAPPQMLVSARADGPVWTVSLSEQAQRREAVVDAERQQAPAGVRLRAPFARPGVVRWVDDPVVGDRFAVGLLDGPPLGVASRRATLEAVLLPTAHGAAIETRADGVGAAFEEGALIVSRGAGLIAASEVANAAAGGTREEPVAFGYAMLDLNEWGQASDGKVRDMLDRLSRRAAEEGSAPGASTAARLELARFLLALELAPEALGALRLASLNQPQLEVDPEFRLMRGAAALMLGRLKDAQGDLAASGLAEDPTAALWRGYGAALAENWSEARAQIEAGRGALPTQPRGWRARFRLAMAEAALRTNDIATAETEAAAALAEANAPDLRAQAQLLQARVARVKGETERALAMFDQLSRSRDEASATRATLEGVRLKRELGKITPEAAADELDALRFRWRGDGLELEIIQTLAAVQADLGRWRDGLNLMRQASMRLEQHPGARRLRLDMSEMFERLFLEGGADALQPIQALGLFYEFRELTPYGPDGDRIVRLLAGRLASMDLLEQAAELLQYQVDNRLEGMGRAQIAADLAALYLSDNRPEQAIAALNATRQPNLPANLVAERRLLEANALIRLGRFDHAVELVEKDQSPGGLRVRVDAAWRRKDWPAAARALQRLMAQAPASGPLGPEDRDAALRLAVAQVLSDDREGLAATRRAYATRLAGAPEADMFDVITGAPDLGSADLQSALRRLSEADLLQRFVAGVRARLGGAAPPAAAAGASGA